jgi:hypothetical protein
LLTRNTKSAPPGGFRSFLRSGLSEVAAKGQPYDRETASLACALRGAAQGCAVLRFVSFVLAPVPLRRGIFSSDRRLPWARSLKPADGPAPSLRRPLLDERTRNVRPLVVRAFGGLALEKLARALTMEKIRLLRPFEFLTPKSSSSAHSSAVSSPAAYRVDCSLS